MEELEGMDIERLLSGYPRSRPELSEEHKRIYVAEYQVNRGGKTFVNKLALKLESWMHGKVVGADGRGRVLELGAGTLNHLRYERAAEVYDIVEPFADLYRDNVDLKRVREIFADIGAIPLNRRYDRIISIATLEHLEDLPRCLALSGILLSPAGIFQAGIPSEGGMLWGLSWRLSTGLAFRIRTGLRYKDLMRHEHINSAPEIIDLIRYFFQRVEVERFPLPLHHLSLYTYLVASLPNLERCRRFLGSLQEAHGPLTSPRKTVAGQN